MADERLQDQAWQLHSKYPQALEWLPNHLPKVQVYRLLVQLAENEGLCTAQYQNYIYFWPRDWSGLPILATRKQDAPLLLPFWFACFYPYETAISADEVALHLSIAPGDELQRRTLFDALKKGGLVETSDELKKAWCHVLKRPFLNESRLRDGREAVFDVIRKRWSDFVHGDMVRIQGIIREIVSLG